MVNALFSKTKPQCIGIYLVDVPETFNNVRNIATYDDFKIESQFIYLPAFEQRIALREKELHNAINMPGNKPENGPFTKEIIRLPNNQGVIFDRNIPHQDDLGRVLEAHIYIDHIAFIITTEILDLSSSKYVERKKTYINAGFTEKEMNEKPTKLAALRSLISRLNGRPDNKIPAEKGICIPNGFISGDSSQHKLVIGFNYKNEDFKLSVNTNNIILADGDTLFDRIDAINDELKSSYMKIFKKESLTVNTIPTETLFLQGSQPYDGKKLHVYDFLLYANEAVATNSKHLVKIGMNSQYKQTRYSEAQMLEIWERVVSSLRYKPNAF